MRERVERGQRGGKILESRSYIEQGHARRSLSSTLDVFYGESAEREIDDSSSRSRCSLRSCHSGLAWVEILQWVRARARIKRFPVRITARNWWILQFGAEQCKRKHTVQIRRVQSGAPRTTFRRLLINFKNDANPEKKKNFQFKSEESSSIKILFPLQIFFFSYLYMYGI